MTSQRKLDYDEAKDKAERMSKRLLQMFPWIKNIRFKGNAEFQPGKRKAQVVKELAEGKEVSFGLNMEMTYLDLKNMEKTCEIVLRFRDHAFNDINLKSYVDNPTTQDLINQYKNTWLIFASGNTPENPSAFVVAKTSDYHNKCFRLRHENGKVSKVNINFGAWAKWIPVGLKDIFGESLVDQAFDRIRQ